MTRSKLIKIRAYLIGGRVIERELPVAADVLEVELPDDGEKRRTLHRTDQTVNGAIVYREREA